MRVLRIITKVVFFLFMLAWTFVVAVTSLGGLLELGFSNYVAGFVGYIGPFALVAVAYSVGCLDGAKSDEWCD